MNYPGDGISEFFNRVNKQGLWFEIQQNSCFEISEKILNLPVNVGRLVKKARALVQNWIFCLDFELNIKLNFII